MIVSAFDSIIRVSSALRGKYYDKEKNPEGIIRLATAENSLLTNELLEVCGIQSIDSYLVLRILLHSVSIPNFI